MGKNKKKVSIPSSMTIQEASDFWDEHSLFEFEGTEEVDLEFKLRKKHYIGIDHEIFKKLKEKAQQMKITPEALLESWIVEKIQST